MLQPPVSMRRAWTVAASAVSGSIVQPLTLTPPGTRCTPSSEPIGWALTLIHEQRKATFAPVATLMA